MEKIQDWIYEISDILFGVFILAGVIFITSHQLYGWFNIGNPLAFGESITTNAPKAILREEENNEDISPVVSVESIDSEVQNNSSEDDNSEAEEVVIRNIAIAPGTSSQSIARALYENNLIDSTNDFLNKLQSMGLERNIKAGSFQIPQNSTLEEIILIITK